MKRPLLIDTDPGVDDALALLMAFAHSDIDVVALTIAAGNVGLEHTTANALRLLEWVKREVPVYAGAARPLVHPAEDAAFVHGRDGFGDAGLSRSQVGLTPGHAAQAICELAQRHAGQLELVMLGPLTNLALAVHLDPSLPRRVRRLVVMGGAVTGRGNTARLATEFNIGFDPEAAHVVFESFPQIELVDWEATLRHGLDAAEFEGWLAEGGAVAEHYRSISAATRRFMQERRGDRWHAADALAMAVALEPEGIEDSADRAVRICVDGALTRGATLVDWNRCGTQASHCRILMEYERTRWRRLLRSALQLDEPH